MLFVAVVQCQETLEDETSESNFVDRKEKRGISLNLGGQGLEGYSYLGPSASSTYGRGLNNRGYTPITEYGEIIKLKLMFTVPYTKARPQNAN